MVSAVYSANELPATSNYHCGWDHAAPRAAYCTIHITCWPFDEIVWPVAIIRTLVALSEIHHSAQTLFASGVLPGELDGDAVLVLGFLSLCTSPKGSKSPKMELNPRSCIHLDLSLDSGAHLFRSLN